MGDNMPGTSVDAAKCIGCSACVSSGFYEMGSDNKAHPVKADLSAEEVEKAKAAASACPVQAITVTE